MSIHINTYIVLQVHMYQYLCRYMYLCICICIYTQSHLYKSFARVHLVMATRSCVCLMCVFHWRTEAFAKSIWRPLIKCACIYKMYMCMYVIM